MGREKNMKIKAVSKSLKFAHIKVSREQLVYLHRPVLYIVLVAPLSGEFRLLPLVVHIEQG